VAQVHLQEEKWKEALLAAEELKKRFPDFPSTFEADYVIGRCYAGTARFDEARAAYERVTRAPGALKSEAAAQAQFMIGETHFHQKQFGEALRAFLRVEILYDYPKWQASALLEAGKCHERLGEWGEAAASYERLLDRYRVPPFANEAAERLAVAQKRAENSPAKDQG
jgi:TolA-binding protein